MASTNEYNSRMMQLGMEDKVGRWGAHWWGSSGKLGRILLLTHEVRFGGVTCREKRPVSDTADVTDAAVCPHLRLRNRRQPSTPSRTRIEGTKGMRPKGTGRAEES